MEVNPIQALLQEMARRRFYGSLEIKLEAGKVVLLRKTETIKPALAHNPSTGGGSYESHKEAE